MEEEARGLLLAKQLGAAAFYGLSSILIITVNKVVLTTYSFPSFQVVGLGQIIVTLLVLPVLKLVGLIQYPDVGWESIRKVYPPLYTSSVKMIGKVLVFPLPLFFIGNLLFGLGGTQKLSLPMFTVLRRFTLLFTLIGESVLLRKYSSGGVQVSIALMIVGAVVAALNDLAFDLNGYTFVLMNNISTTCNALYTKKMLDSDALGKYGILFYNALVMVVPVFLLAYFNGDLKSAYEYEGWKDMWFLVYFAMSSFMGFVLMYATILCTAVNSPLTTMVTGCMKNILVTYLGMFLGGDYLYSHQNFIGINMSVVGSMVYSATKYYEQQAASKPKQNGHQQPRASIV